MKRSWLLPFFFSLLVLIGLSLQVLIQRELGTHQLFLVILSLSLFWLTSHLPSSFFWRHPWLMWSLALFLLIMPLILNISTRGTARWLYLGPFSFQPSQLAFVLLPLTLIVRRSRQDLTSWRSTLEALALILPPALLIALAPDLGTTLFFLFMMLILLFLTSLPVKHLLSLFALSVLVIFLSWQSLLLPYQKTRLLTFFKPTHASQAAVYNLRQSLIAIGAGGISGTDLGAGTQSQLRFLPERKTDFIFASYAEQFGFLGSLLLISLYLGLGLVSLFSAQMNPQFEERIWLAYAGSLFLTQVFLALAVNLGLLPVTGLPLPLLAAGGSSLLVLSFSLGLAQSCLKNSPRIRTLHLE